MKAVHECINRREASLIAGFLSDRGIRAEVRGGAWQAVEGELVNFRGALPRIYVVDDWDYDQARALVADYLDLLRRAPEGEPWTCPACGEALEPQFQSCWKCQTEKPA
jgi:hypothetical protein